MVTDREQRQCHRIELPLEANMLEKRVGDPCPHCAKPLIRRASTFRTIMGDVAYCARCAASYELIDAPADRTCIRRPQPA
jgi:predicted RNA-binding Zn-ribbon protein involved in translation (DUF1610 family)